MGNIETAMKLYRLKSISGIEDYLEAATRGVLWKKTLLKNFAISTGKQLYWRLFNKVADLQACNFIERDFNTGVFLCILWIFIFFWETSTNAASDYSFTLVIYLFFGCLFKKNYDLLIFYSEESVYRN